MRYSILKVSPYVFISMCQSDIIKAKIVGNILPPDATFIRAFVDNNDGWGYINLVLESESFDELKEGDPIPVLPYPSFSRIE